VCDDAGRKRKSSWEGLDAELRVCFPLTRSSGPGGLNTGLRVECGSWYVTRMFWGPGHESMKASHSQSHSHSHFGVIIASLIF
jgi:hypothetical protein